MPSTQVATVIARFEVKANPGESFNQETMDAITEMIFRRLHMDDMSVRLALAEDIKNAFKLQEYVEYSGMVNDRTIFKA